MPPAETTILATMTVICGGKPARRTTVNSIQMVAAEQAIQILQRDLAAARATIDAQAAKLAAVPEYIEYHMADREHGPFTESFDDWYSRTHLRA